MMKIKKKDLRELISHKVGPADAREIADYVARNRPVSFNHEPDLLAALEPLVAIWEAYKANELDEARPERGDQATGVELLSGRGGKSLLMLTDCAVAYHAVNDFKRRMKA